MATTTCSPAEERIIRQDASRWVVRLSDTDCDSDTHAAFDEWYRARPEHAAAFDRLSQIWGRLGRVQPETLRAKPGRTRRAVAGSVLALALLCGAIVATWYEAPDYRAGHRIERVALPDGSTAVLDAGSAIRLDFADGRRTVTLLRGRALFEAQPRQAGMAAFTVRTDQGSATALGTRFEVSRPPDGMSVRVYQHNVALLCTACDPVQSLTLAPGESAQLQAGRWQREAEATGTAPSWSQGLLRLDDVTLAEAVRALQPYSGRYIVVANGALDRIRVSGTVSPADTRKALEFLLARQPVRVHELPGLLWLR